MRGILDTVTDKIQRATARRYFFNRVSPKLIEILFAFNFMRPDVGEIIRAEAKR